MSYRRPCPSLNGASSFTKWRAALPNRVLKDILRENSAACLACEPKTGKSFDRGSIAAETAADFVRHCLEVLDRSAGRNTAAGGDEHRADVGQVIELLRGLAKEQGKTVVVVTHDQRVFAMADRIYSVENGNVHETCKRATLQPHDSNRC